MIQNVFIVNTNKKKFLLGGVALLVLLSGTQQALALELDYPFLCPTDPCNPSAPDFIAWLYKFALGSVGALGVLTIAWGGIKYITSRGNPSLQTDAKEWIWNAILGIALLVGSFLILFTINPNLTRLGVPDIEGIVEPASAASLYQICVERERRGGATLGAAVVACGCSRLQTSFTAATVSCRGSLILQGCAFAGKPICVHYTDKALGFFGGGGIDLYHSFCCPLQ